MSFLTNIFTVPLSWLYGLGVYIRHQLFNHGILKSEEFDIPIISIGNITVGGTGKTPHAEFFVEMLSPHYNVAVLSRGYKRRTKGFVLAQVDMPSRIIGDEPKQIKHKYPDIPVAVCEKRSDGIKALRQAHPEVDLIILDDAFQHRYVEPWLSVLLIDYQRPIFDDYLLPHGRLRDLKSQLSRANFIFVTKCPKDVKPIDLRVMMRKLNLFPYQSLFFTRMKSQEPLPIFGEFNQEPLVSSQKAIAMSGLASSKGFVESVESSFDVVKVINFDDHHVYKRKDIKQLEKLLAELDPSTVIITTEKDAVKLAGGHSMPDDIKRRLFYIPITVEVVSMGEDGGEDEILRKTIPYVSENQKYSMLHPQ